MATAKPKPFASLTSSIIANNNESQPTPEDTPAQDKVTSFVLEGAMRKPLNRVVHGLGRKASLKSVINAALAYYFENEPKAKTLINKPTPDEENEA